MLSKLVKKGYLKRDKQVVSYYSAILTRRQYRQEQTQKLLDGLFEGDSRALLTMLAETRKIKKEDIDELRQFWEDDDA